MKIDKFIYCDNKCGTVLTLAEYMDAVPFLNNETPVLTCIRCAAIIQQKLNVIDKRTKIANFQKTLRPRRSNKNI